MRALSAGPGRASAPGEKLSRAEKEMLDKPCGI